MADYRPIGRRRILTALGLAPAAVLKGGPQVRQTQATWEREQCPGCGRDVMFLPRQRRNTCGWCGRKVRHAC